jgi:hypothetical protein
VSDLAWFHAPARKTTSNATTRSPGASPRQLGLHAHRVQPLILRRHQHHAPRRLFPDRNHHNQSRIARAFSGARSPISDEVSLHRHLDVDHY